MIGTEPFWHFLKHFQFIQSAKVLSSSVSTEYNELLSFAKVPFRISATVAKSFETSVDIKLLIVCSVQSHPWIARHSTISALHNTYWVFVKFLNPRNATIEITYAFVYFLFFRFLPSLITLRSLFKKKNRWKDLKEDRLVYGGSKIIYFWWMIVIASCVSLPSSSFIFFGILWIESITFQKLWGVEY